MPIVKYAPFADTDDFPTGLRLFQDSINRLLSEDGLKMRPWAPAVDILETENELILKADVPGVELKDIDIQLENGTLTVKGERKFEKEEKIRASIGWSGATVRLFESSPCLKPWTPNR
jgi:HSP20 family protein